MNPLLPFMEYQLPLGLEDKFPKSEMSVEAALRDTFNILSTTLGLTGENSSTPIFFSIDSFNEELVGIIEQEDKFAEQVWLNTGIAHAKICHMRCYATAKGAHWHALFARMDEEGQLKEVLLTDSRLNSSKQGITAQKDINGNSFLKENQSKCQFIPSLEQPLSTAICWIYALANLAALATTGRVYKKQTIHPIGLELCQLIESTTIASKKQENNSKGKQTETVVLNLETTSLVEIVPMVSSTLPEFPPESSNKQPTIYGKTGKSHTLFSISQPSMLHQSTFRNVDRSLPLLISPQKETQSSTALHLRSAGVGLLLLGAGVFIVGVSLTAVIPLCLPISLTFLGIGIALSIIGAVMLAGDCLAKNCCAAQTKKSSFSI